MKLNVILIFIFICNNCILAGQENHVVTFHDEEKEVTMQNIDQISQEISEKVANSIPEEEICKFVVQIKDIIEDFIKEQDIESHVSDIQPNIKRAPYKGHRHEDKIKLKEDIEKAIANKMLSFITPEYMDKISKLMLAKYEKSLENQSTMKKVVSAVLETSIVKTVTYRILASAITLLNSYKYLQITFIAALTFGAIDIGTKVVLYYMHEKAWDPKIQKCLIKYCSCCKKHK